jgi:hypothetical protein
MTLLQFMLLGITILAIRLANWRPPGWLFWFTILWGIFFYNGARTIILGQFSILVGLGLFLALWAIEHRRDGWAGVFLSLTTIKPQMVLLVLIFLFGWALFQRRWRLIGSFTASVLVLVASSLLLIPTWPVDLYHNIIAYTQYVAFGTPLENLLRYFLPSAIAAPSTMVLSALLFLALLPSWWRAWRTTPIPVLSTGQNGIGQGAYTWAILLSLIVGSFITFRSGTTNQMILYLPLFFFFRRLAPWPASKGGLKVKVRRAAITVALIEVGLAVFMWWVFIATLEGNWEHVMMHGLLPALILLLYAADWRALRRAAYGKEQP